MNGAILATPFNGVTLNTTGPGAPSGFTDINAVVATMGDDYITKTPRMVVYGDDVHRVIFSDVDFYIDEQTYIK